MRAPHEYFVKYLISLGIALEDINRSLQAYSLPIIDETYSARLRAELDIPEDFRPKVPTHAPSIAWLRRNKLHSLWYRKEFKHIDDCFAILTKPKIRMIVEMLTMTSAPFADISSFVKDQYAVVLSPESIEAFTLYFNNYSLLSPEEIRKDASERREYWRIAAVMDDIDYIRWYLGAGTSLKIEQIVTETTREAFQKMRGLHYMPEYISTAKMFGIYAEAIKWGVEELKVFEQAEEAPRLKTGDFNPPDFKGELPKAAEVTALEDSPLSQAEETVEDVTTGDVTTKN